MFSQDGASDETGNVVLQRVTSIARFSLTIVLTKLATTAPVLRHIFESVAPTDRRWNSGGPIDVRRFAEGRNGIRRKRGRGAWRKANKLGRFGDGSGVWTRRRSVDGIVEIVHRAVGAKEGIRRGEILTIFALNTM